MNNKDIEKYKNDIINFLDTHDFKGLILDFRKHHGGNMWPLVDALSRFLDNSTLFAWSNEKVSFKDKKWRNLINGKVKVNQSFIKGANINYPIAVIIGSQTASAGEFVASCFINRNNVKIFGENTSGYLSVNNTIKIDNFEVNLPVKLQISRNDKFMEYIEPDVYTTKPITEAKLWIRNN
jgi:C-terminal processing protease CtpA/Prc